MIRRIGSFSRGFLRNSRAYSSLPWEVITQQLTRRFERISTVSPAMPEWLEGSLPTSSELRCWASMVSTRHVQRFEWFCLRREGNQIVFNSFWQREEGLSIPLKVLPSTRHTLNLSGGECLSGGVYRQVQLKLTEKQLELFLGDRNLKKLEEPQSEPLIEASYRVIRST